MLWTILTVVLVVVALLLLFTIRLFPGGKNLGEAEEMHFRGQSGLWTKDDADRFRR